MPKPNVNHLLGRKVPSPKEIYDDLTERHDDILLRIEEEFEVAKSRNPDAERIVRPSLFVAQLATQSLSKNVLTKKGLDNGTSMHPLEELTLRARPYWYSVDMAGFQPEVRSNMLVPGGAAVWLMLRKPE
ncbi:hypothetical protein HY004_00090 [Candidatus Saccharibacteria bacterium]|nr:hypothetical protein [Candidatus Saccharibacteria bacterium]